MILNMVEEKNPKSKHGFTPLHEAARYGHIEIAKMILDVVDDKSPKNCYGETPQFMAMKHRHPYEHLRE